MTLLALKDGSRLFYKDWGVGAPIVFAHGWPLSADAWDAQMLYFGDRGYRVVAHDRRGHGRSEQTWQGNDMDTYADDLDELMEHLALEGAVMVGHSTGGGEVARYVSRHGTERLAGLVLLGAVPPLMLQTADNPNGTPLPVFDAIRAGVYADRSQYFKDLATPFYGFNRPGAKPSQGMIDAFWRLGMQAGIKAAYDCIAQFSQTDFTEDLRRMDVPTLIVHGDADQIVPIKAAALRSIELAPRAELLVYEGAPHGLAQTQAERFNADLLAFVERCQRQGARGAAIDDSMRSRGKPSSPQSQTDAKSNPG